MNILDYHGSTVKSIIKFRYPLEFCSTQCKSIPSEHFLRLRTATVRRDSINTRFQLILVLRKIPQLKPETIKLLLLSGLLESVVFDSINNTKIQSTFTLDLSFSIIADYAHRILEEHRNIFSLLSVDTLLELRFSGSFDFLPSPLKDLFVNHLAGKEEDILNDFNFQADLISKRTGINLFNNDFTRAFGHCGFHKLLIDIDCQLHAKSHQKTNTISIGTPHSPRRRLIANIPFLLGNTPTWNHLESEDKIISAYSSSFPWFRSCYYSSFLSKYPQSQTSSTESPRRISLTWNMGSLSKRLPSSFFDKTLNNTKHIVIHFRDRQFYSESSTSSSINRNSSPSNAEPILFQLLSQGYQITSFSRPSVFSKRLRNLLNYELGETEASRHLQYQLLRQTDFMICCASGPACAGTPIGIPMIAINWWPFLQYPFSPHDIVCPKHIYDQSNNRYISPKDYIKYYLDHSHCDPFEPLHGFQLVETSSEEIEEAVASICNLNHTGCPTTIMGPGFNSRITRATLQKYL